MGIRFSSMLVAAGLAAAGLRAQSAAVPIPLIQGAGTVSPYVGQRVTTTGVVTARQGSGFFLQDAAGDGDEATSDGLYVFTSSAPPAAAAVGNLVEVTGGVAEFRRSSAPNAGSLTELTSPAVKLIAEGQAQPDPRPITAADLTVEGGLGQLERFEGMRVSVASITAVGPTGGSVSEANATAATNGLFYAVITGTARPFREPGVQRGDPDPEMPSASIPRYDGNPEVFAVDSDALPGTAAVNVAAGAVMREVTGILHQDYGEYRLYPEATLKPEGDAAAARVVPEAQPGELKIASFNLERFYDTVNDPSTSDAVLTEAALQRRLNKASLAIRNVLGAPDVLSVVEMENLAVLEALAAKINADAEAAGQPSPGYRACLEEGNDPGGIDVGFLYGARVAEAWCEQRGKDETYTDPKTGKEAVLNDRPPLVLRGEVRAEGSETAYRFTVVANHLRSLSGIDDAEDGARVRAKRNAQAEYLAGLLQELQEENVISAGDYNAYAFSDGYVDVMGTVRGAPAAEEEVFVAGRKLVWPEYVNLTETVTPEEGYTYVFSGSAQTLDHLLVNQRVLPRVTRYAVARLDADFPETLRSDGERPERVSDHDAPVVYIRLTEEEPAATRVKVNRWR